MTELAKARKAAHGITALLAAASLARASGAREQEHRALAAARLKCFDLRAVLDRLERAAEFGERDVYGRASGGDAA